MDRVYVKKSFDLNGNGDKAYVGFPAGAELVHVKFTGLTTDAGGATVKVDSIINGASRGDGDLGSIVIPAASQFGKALKQEDITTRFVEAGGAIIEVSSSSAASSSFCEVEICYIDLGLSQEFSTSITEV